MVIVTPFRTFCIKSLQRYIFVIFFAFEISSLANKSLTLKNQKAMFIKTFVSNCLVLFFCINCIAQDKLVRIPHVVLSNGTTIETSYQKEGEELTIFITNNPDEVTVITVDKNGDVVDVDFSFSLADRLIININNNVDVIVVTKEEEEYIVMSLEDPE